MKSILLMAGLAVSCFLAGIIVCYLWLRIQSSPAVTNSRSVTSETEPPEAGAGGPGRVAAGNVNARAAKFEELDLDQDGKLSLTEFSVGRKPAEAAKWFERRDADHDGSISREEFLPFSAGPTAR